jgi:isocitrate dehydrogenase kinase/phosphatase
MPIDDPSPPPALADTLLAGYEAYVQEFHAITRRAQGRFEARDWKGSIQDGLARLRLYKSHIDGVAERCLTDYGAESHRREFWEHGKEACLRAVAPMYDDDLALMFVDSVIRRTLAPDTAVPYGTVGVDPKLDPDVQTHIMHTYAKSEGTPLGAVVERILKDCGFRAAWRNRAGDAQCAADAIEEGLKAHGGAAAILQIEMLRPLFYRNKGAYVVGRIRTPHGLTPLAFALAHSARGIVVDAVLDEESDLRRIFSYTRSNFHVELEGQYRELLDFLHSIMPHKNWAALYSSIGFMNPAKIQLSKDLDAHRRQPGTKLTAAWGIPGLVMVVFTSPGFPYVFKVIRDDDQVRKLRYIGRQGVAERYRLVQEGDRVGRLLDTITFHHLRFARDDFEPKILRELLDTASASVKEVGDDILITRCYAQRDATPLPIYLRQVDWPEIERVLNDLGWCIKDIAAAGLFPGEFDLKNFGVAEDGRVVFFDFDGLDELRKFSFEKVPLEGSLAQEECFEYLLHTYRTNLIHVFRRLHADLFAPEHWRRIQRLLGAGEVLDTFPYPAHKRLDNRRAHLAAAAARTPFALPAAVEAELERFGLKTAHRRGLLAWEPLGRGMVVGRGRVDALSPAQRAAVHETFAVEKGGIDQGPDVVVLDDMPAFICLPGLSATVLDLSAQYMVAAAVAEEWRERVQRELFPEGHAEFRAVP